MKKFLSVLWLALFFVTPAHADLSVGAAKQYARVIYDVSLNGGASVSHSLNAEIPAGAIITNAYVYINQAFTDSGTGSLALECAGTRDIMEYRDITANSINDIFKAGVGDTNFGASAMIPLTTSAAAVGIASVPTACQVKAVVRGDSGYVPLTAGKLTLLLEYFRQ